MERHNENSAKPSKVSNFLDKKVEVENTFYRETREIINDLLDSRQRTVAWMLYYSMKSSYPFDLVGLGIEIWCNYCEDRDPLIDDESKFAASIELFVSKFWDKTTASNYEILYKYGLHTKYDSLSLNL